LKKLIILGFSSKLEIDPLVMYQNKGDNYLVDSLVFNSLIYLNISGNISIYLENELGKTFKQI
jgi:hypothetical protein